ncbi:uncharacterized protein [Amphiura filiformis]|uniref:uncharacterized protein n=1 Tax=Amphiura filiformis TaxID=82378 RepID=UPI003B218D7C
MQPSTSKTILPIFNKKKRPRQAIFTYPNNGTNVNSGNDPQRNFQPANSPVPVQQQPGYMQSHQPQRNQQSYTNSQSFQNRNNANTGRSFKGAGAPSSAGAPPQQPGFLSQSNYSRGQTNGRQQMAPNKNTPLMQQRQQHQQTSRQSLDQPRYNQAQYGGSAGGSSHAIGRENIQQHRSTTPQTNSQGRSNFTHNATPTKRQYASSSTPNQSNQTRSFNGQRGTQNTEPQTKRTFIPSNNRPALLLPFQVPGTEGKDDTTTAPVAAALDKTVKILTSSIEGMKHWSQYTDSVGLLLFEMFGILNSAISTNDSSTAKLFNLREGQHSQRCIFYETDHYLQRLTRGQWLRCVGNLDKKTGLFRVVTVRPVSQQEQATYKAIIVKCDQAMNERLAEMQEQ